MLTNLKSSSASARGASLVLASGGISLQLDDTALASALRRELLGRAGLFETGPEAAAVIVTDREPGSQFLAPRERVLRIGTARDGRNALQSLEPSLILSAAAVIAAGYVLDRVEVSDEPRRPPAHLSQRERQVAVLLVDGASNKVIARALDISVHTAKFHVTAILEKLGARNRADAVAIILREGLVAL